MLRRLALILVPALLPAPTIRLDPAQEMVRGEIARRAEIIGLPEDFALAQAWRESRWYPGAHGDAGEVGPMQVNPAWRPEVVYMRWDGQAGVGLAILMRWWVACGGDEACAERSYRTGRLQR